MKKVSMPITGPSKCAGSSTSRLVDNDVEMWSNMGSEVRKGKAKVKGKGKGKAKEEEEILANTVKVSLS